MPYTDAQKEATTRYKKKNLKRIPLEVTFEQYDTIKDVAEKLDLSVNGFIKTAITEKLSLSLETQNNSNLL